MAFPDLWGEGTALVAIAAWNAPAATAGIGVNFSAAVSSIDIDLGDKDFDVINAMKGAKLVKFSFEDETTITFEGYAVELDTTETDLIQRFYVNSASWDTTETLSADNELLVHNDFRVTILWTQDTTVTSAEGLVPATSEAIRAIFKKCRLVSVKPAFTDNELKWTFKFKLASHAKTAVIGGPFVTSGGNDQSNIRWESSSASATLAAIAAYKT